MLCSHFPINDSSGCLHITVYLAVKLQVTTKSQKVHISSHDVLQKSDMTPQNFLFAFIDELWKTKKIIILQKCWIKKKKKKYWRYHHFTHVYQKPQSGTVPEIRSDTIQFCHSRPFFAIYPPPLRTSPS